MNILIFCKKWYNINVSITETKNNGITTLNITEDDKVATIEFDSEMVCLLKLTLQRHFY